ncbi:hypothetical protein [Gordonia malaquae]|uniref:hypothetical protein n=1 Tax=Gordonia malaquae TaxID=410332 RepID=UPI003016DEC7
MVTTTEKGLGWTHQQQTAALKADHTDGEPCWWCGQPMFLDPARNWDRKSLSGDHSVPRAAGGSVTDRLLHGTCNSERGDGSRDHLRPAGGNDVDPSEPDPLGVRRFDWPF